MSSDKNIFHVVDQTISRALLQNGIAAGYPTPVTGAEAGEHFRRQDELVSSGLITRLSEIFEDAVKLKTSVSLHFENYRDTIAKEIQANLASGGNYAIVDVDSQIDFLIKNAALCPPENTSKKTTTEHILLTMATLDAALKVISEHPEFAKRLTIVSTQDVHRFNRPWDSADSRVIRGVFKSESTGILSEEFTELSTPNFKTAFGGHCVAGTVGVDIFGPIKTRMQALEGIGVSWKKFAKVTFSAPKSALLIQDGVDPSDQRFRRSADPIWDKDTAISYKDFFRNGNFKKIYLIGICADVCVKKAALELRNVVSCMITVIEASTFYLYANARPNLEKTYREAGVGILQVRGYSSNGDPVPTTNPLLAFYLRHPKACVAILECIAVAAVVMIALSQASAAAVVAVPVIAAAAIALSVVGVFYTRPAAEHKTLEPVMSKSNP